MKELLLILSLARCGDIVTTQHALRNGYIEGNPLLSSNPNINLVEGIGATVGEVWLINKLSKQHPKIARLIIISAISLETFVSVRNYKVTR